MQSVTKIGAESASIQSRSDLHLARKIWHLLTGLGMFLILRYASPWVTTAALVTGTVLFVPFDLLRQSRPKLNEFLIKRFSRIIRKHEINALAGTTYLLTGTWIIYTLFPKPITEMTLLFLAVGDPVASLFGIRYGKDRIWGRKTLQGSLAAMVVCTLLALGYFYSDNLMVERLFVVSILSGFAAAVSEMAVLFQLDDNLTFPVFCAGQLYVIFYLFGGLS